MASIYKSGKGWRVQVYEQGVRDSKTLPTRQEAARWGLEREAELTGKKLPDKTFAAAMRAYARDVAPSHAGEHWEIIRLTAMEQWPIAKRQLAGLSSDDFALWRDARLKAVKPGTVAREMNLMRSVLEHARQPPNRWIRVNPMDDVKWPKPPRGRCRRVTPEEIAEVRLAFGLGKGYPAGLATQRVGLSFLLALETGLRSGEMVGLQWPDVHLVAQFVVLTDTKNGDRREVPLSTTAVKILRALPGTEGSVFNLDDKLRDALWRKNRPASLADLHFHDSRAEAIWRLSKKLDVLQLARAIGHKDLKSLLHYYAESASDMAMRLG